MKRKSKILFSLRPINVHEGLAKAKVFFSHFVAISLIQRVAVNPQPSKRSCKVVVMMYLTDSVVQKVKFIQNMSSFDEGNVQKLICI